MIYIASQPALLLTVVYYDAVIITRSLQMCGYIDLSLAFLFVFAHISRPSALVSMPFSIATIHIQLYIHNDAYLYVPTNLPA